MGCLFGCFRIRDSDRRHHHVETLKSTDGAASRNRLSSLFLSEEKEDSQCKDRATHSPRSLRIDKELRDKAKFPKAQGTKPEAPVELQKASTRLYGSLSNSNDRDEDPSKFHSWIPMTSLKKIQMDKQPDWPSTPSKVCEESSKGLGSSEHTPSSCLSHEQIPEDDEAGSVNTSAKVQLHQDGYAATSVKKYGSPDFDNVANGKTRIRSQYVHAVRNPVESAAQWKVLKEEDFESRQLSCGLGQYHEQPGKACLNSDLRENEPSDGEELKVEESLSSWLKPLPPTQDGVVPRRHRSLNKTPGDRPIIGMVAAHWYEDEPTHISPKWWDGNGIPNSTNKYKEDQKVSWHATPFEERLEKALSEESVISQRKHINGRPMVLDENEESDTALSQLQPSTQLKPVVSF